MCAPANLRTSYDTRHSKYVVRFLFCVNFAQDESSAEVQVRDTEYVFKYNGEENYFKRIILKGTIIFDLKISKAI